MFSLTSRTRHHITCKNSFPLRSIRLHLAARSTPIIDLPSSFSTTFVVIGPSSSTTFTTSRRTRDQLGALARRKPSDHPRPRSPPPCRRPKVAGPDWSGSLTNSPVPGRRPTPKMHPRTHPLPRLASVSRAVLSRTSPGDDDAT